MQPASVAALDQFDAASAEFRRAQAREYERALLLKEAIENEQRIETDRIRARGITSEVAGVLSEACASVLTAAERVAEAGREALAVLDDDEEATSAYLRRRLDQVEQWLTATQNREASDG